MTWETLVALSGLFLTAFGAATILPFQSEVVLGAMLLAKTAPTWILFAIASLGNTLGSVVNYALGRWAAHFEGHRWFPASKRQLTTTRRFYARWGVWSLLLSWAPFADPLTVVAGVMRTPFWLFLILVAIAKSGRYAVMIWLFDQVT